MKNKTRIILIIVIVVVAMLLIRWFVCINPSKKGFSIPKGSRVSVAYSTGRDVKERSVIRFYDQSGEEIGEKKYDTALSMGCIGQDPISGENHLFYHEGVLFEDGHSLKNQEMEDTYSFASNDGMDDVYDGGYIEKWGMFYKNIPHGYAYALPDYGHFDLVTIYDRHSVHNVRIQLNGYVTIDEKEGRIYTFTELNDNGNLPYEIIEKEGDSFSVRSGKIDMTGSMIHMNALTETGILYAWWDGDDLYLFLYEIGEDETIQTDRVIHCKRKRERISFYREDIIEWKKLTGDKKTRLRPRGLVRQDPERLYYYTTSEPYGLLTYDKKTHELNFKKYAVYKNDSEMILCKHGDEVYASVENPDGKSSSIYRITDNQPVDPIVSVPDEPNPFMFEVDFFVFE